MTSSRHLALMTLMREIEAPGKTYQRAVRLAAALASDSDQWQAAVDKGNAALDEIEAAVQKWTATNAPQAADGDTLPAWLYQRFAVIHGCPPWDQIDDGQHAYWEHHAAAVRRAVTRGGFKDAAAAASGGGR